MGFSKAIITSGPTREWIDPVRYISNASSGKMGFHIAERIAKWIPEVVYIHGQVLESYKSPIGTKRISVETTFDLCDAVLSEIQTETILIMAAAPVDFRPLKSGESKIKKKTGMKPFFWNSLKIPIS